MLNTGWIRSIVRTPGVDRSAVHEIWEACRHSKITRETPGMAPGFVQANLVVLPKAFAFDFLTFCLRNPKPCPLLDVTRPGMPKFDLVADGADLRTDLPMYRIWREGVLTEEKANIVEEYGSVQIQDTTEDMDDGMVGFALGCSFSWEDLLVEKGLAPRHVTMGCNVPMFRTNVPNVRSGPFGGNLVVSMRPYKPSHVDDVVRITSAYPGAHGGPVHVGRPDKIGIACLDHPDFGDAVDIEEGEVPVFWACGVTPQSAIEEAAIPIAITHAPGHMLVCDLLNSELLSEES